MSPFALMVYTRKKRLRERIKAHGYAPLWVYLPKRSLENASLRAKTLGIPRGCVINAALDFGLSRLSHSEIIRTYQRWREFVGKPGEDFGKYIRQWNARHRARKKKEAA